MIKLAYSCHAESRMSQRGIQRSIVELILKNGTNIGRGRILLKRRKASMMIQSLKRQLKKQRDQNVTEILKKRIDQIERSVNKVIVVTDGCLITVYHQTRTLR